MIDLGIDEPDSPEPSQPDPVHSRGLCCTEKRERGGAETNLLLFGEPRQFESLGEAECQWLFGIHMAGAG